MKKTVLYLLLFLPLLCYSQKDSRVTSLDYKMPESDFIIFSIYGKDDAYTGNVDIAILQENIRNARMMSMIPLEWVSVYHKGEVVEDTRINPCYFPSIMDTNSIFRGAAFASDVKKVELMSETFDRKRKLSKKKEQLLTKQNIYLLENEKEYVLKWYEF